MQDREGVRFGNFAVVTASAKPSGAFWAQRSDVNDLVSVASEKSS
jgi:hypothetical protein